MPNEVIAVDHSRSRGAAAAVAAGFHDNEIWTWMYPNDWQRHRILGRHYRAMLRHVFTPRGTAWTTPDYAGGALWMAPGTLEQSRRERLVELSSLVPLGVTGLARGSRFERLIETNHPEEPHWYLNTLSVRPESQGRGYGSALIAPGLARADSENRPAYLETQRESNIPFYRRFGFELIDRVQLADSPPLWLMWREAKGAKG